MRTLLSAVGAAALCLCGLAAQDAAGLVTGSGNYFSPIVSNLDRAVAFYQNGLGLEVTGQPSNANDNAPLRNMFGLPAAQIRWTVARTAGQRNGVEIVEIARADGRPLNRAITDPGAATLVTSTTENLSQLAERLERLGGRIIGLRTTSNIEGANVAVVQDPDNHYVELIGSGPSPPRVRFTVQSVERAVALYRDRLGLLDSTAQPTTDEWLKVAGITAGGAQPAVLEVPGSGLILEFMQFNAAPARAGLARIQDPGATRLQLRVRDLDAAITALTMAGGRVVSTGGRPVELPAGNGATIRAAIVQDPDNLFVVLIEEPRA